MQSPSADQSVRVAWAQDAPAIADVQVRAWRKEYAGVLPAEMLDSMAAETLAETWRTSIVEPKQARNRVLVALDRAAVRGFVLTSASSDPDADAARDAEVAELTVDPDHGRQGHGSRLVQAAIDTLRADRFSVARMWLNSIDDVRRSFLTDAGFAPDGAHRELDLHGDGSVVVKQVRLHASLADSPADSTADSTADSS